MDVERVDGAAAARERLYDMLLADEGRHNLAFGILSTAAARPEVYPELHAWLVHDGDRLMGAALRTPPHNLVLARPEGEEVLSTLTVAVDRNIPGVVGAVPEVDQFAASWVARLGGTTRVVFDQRIYALRAVVPAPPTAGAMRLAMPADRGLVLDWVRAFADEVFPKSRSRDAEEDAAARLERSVDARLASAEAGIALWELDARPVSLAGFGGPTPNGIRIGPVYTPPELRGHGYGTAVTAAASQLMLDRGHRFCFLYTDLANPTSNAIYMRIGYEPVCDSREIAFTPVPGGQDTP